MKKVFKRFNRFGFSLFLLAMFLFAGTLALSGCEGASEGDDGHSPIISQTFSVGSHPSAIAIGSSGDVWVANAGSHDVTELSQSGEIIGTHDVGSHPSAIAIDSSGDVWVANKGSHDVTELIKAAKGHEYFPYSGPEWP